MRTVEELSKDNNEIWEAAGRASKQVIELQTENEKLRAELSTSASLCQQNAELLDKALSLIEQSRKETEEVRKKVLTIARFTNAGPYTEDRFDAVNELAREILGEKKDDQ